MMDATTIAALKSTATNRRLPANTAGANNDTFSAELTRAQSRASETYAVQRGDTLSDIVLQRFERAGKTPTNQQLYDAVSTVARDNGLDNPNLIFPGQKLDLGAVAAPAAINTSSAHASAPPVGSAVAPQVAAIAPPPILAASLQSPPAASLHPKAQAKPSAATAALPAASEIAPSFSPIDRGVIGLAEYRPQSPWRNLIDGKARLTSEFGPREHPVTGHRHDHRGIDLAARPGTTIYPLRPGTVVTSGWRGGYGNTVIVRHDDGVETLYGHNAKNLVKPGDRVDATTPMALVGSTGNATGPHLHFEVRRENQALNPIPFLTDNQAAPAAGS